MINPLHYIKLPHFFTYNGITTVTWLRQCHKGRLGYNCHGRPGECGHAGKR